MSAIADRPEFTPPPTRGLLRAIGLAILAHAALVAALTWGVRWKRDAEVIAVQAELWASVPVQAAPAAQPPPPAPVPKPEPIAPKAEPKPLAKPDIALERERERRRKQEAEAIEQEQRKRQAEQQRAREQRDKEELARLEAQRKANLARMAGLAGATGPATASGSVPQSAGPSSTYAGRVIGRIKPNIVFTEAPTGNPTTIVEVRTAPDGTITGRRLLRSSGQRAWDEAVMKALDKTDALPKDTDGRVPPVLEISFRPLD